MLAPIACPISSLKYCWFQSCGDSVTPSSEMNSPATIFRILRLLITIVRHPTTAPFLRTAPATAGFLKPKVGRPDEHSRRSSVEFAVDRDIRKVIRLCLAIGMFVLVAPAACSAAPQPKGEVVDITLGDFRIDNATPSVDGGDVVLQVHNDAPATHEFVVVRTDLPSDGLPLGPAGWSVQEDGL